MKFTFTKGEDTYSIKAVNYRIAGFALVTMYPNTIIQLDVEGVVETLYTPHPNMLKHVAGMEVDQFEYDYTEQIEDARQSIRKEKVSG